MKPLPRAPGSPAGQSRCIRRRSLSIRGLPGRRTYAVTRADVTRDLRYVKVYVSILEDDKADDMIKALKKAAGFIRRELGARVDLRYTPEVLFERDRNIAYGVHIAQVLKEVAPREEQDHGDE